MGGLSSSRFSTSLRGFYPGNQRRFPFDQIISCSKWNSIFPLVGHNQSPQRVLPQSVNSNCIRGGMDQWDTVFQLFQISRILGQTRKVHPKFQNEILENFCSILSPARNSRKIWLNGKCPQFPSLINIDSQLACRFTSHGSPTHLYTLPRKNCDKKNDKYYYCLLTMLCE